MIETVADHLTLERDGRVAVVTVDRPDARNAMTFDMYEGLHDLCERLDADVGVRVVILRGAGDNAFVSGTDIRQFQTFKTREDALGYEARISRVLDRLAGLRKPTIAMIQGTPSAAACSCRWRAISGWRPNTRASAPRSRARSATSPPPPAWPC